MWKDLIVLELDDGHAMLSFPLLSQSSTCPRFRCPGDDSLENCKLGKIGFWTNTSYTILGLLPRFGFHPISTLPSSNKPSTTRSTILWKGVKISASLKSDLRLGDKLASYGCWPNSLFAKHITRFIDQKFISALLSKNWDWYLLSSTNLHCIYLKETQDNSEFNIFNCSVALFAALSFNRRLGWDAWHIFSDSRRALSKKQSPSSLVVIPISLRLQKCHLTRDTRKMG